MRVDLFDFELPEDRIALRPAEPRDAARLLVVKSGPPFEDRIVRDLPSLLEPGDLLVFNDTKVIPAQLSGMRRRGDALAQIDATLHMRVGDDRWKAFVRPAKRLAVGDRINFGHDGNSCFLGKLDATVVDKGEAGEATLAFDLSGVFLDEALHAVGHIPLPPYIASKRADDERDRADYQTIYAREEGAVAAPTAGLHFTPALFEALDKRGIERAFVTLHVGAGTFLPVKADDTADHKMHAESGTISAATAAAVNAVRARGNRVVAVGTTSLRLIESAADPDGKLAAWSGATDIFITPGYRFKTVDGLMTNFHLPRSTLFMLVSAFAGVETMRSAYAHAIGGGYEILFLWRCQPAMAGRMSTEKFGFRLIATDGKARRGEISMPRGVIRTPAFMPVGTGGTVKALYMDQVRGAGADIILGNTYHLMLRPGAERVARLGGLHEFARWPHPILTDSGGFQVMSLSQLRKLDENGVTFRSHIDGAPYALTPERSIEIQGLLDSDIQMQLDECVALPAKESEIERAMEMSLRWAERCKTAFGKQPGKAMFGIVQGGDVARLRERSADALSAMQLKGYAVGGLAVGEPQAVMLDMLDITCPRLPADKPRYLMGVGTPDDLLKSVARGIDMFDCVMPTRAGRHGLAYTRRGKVNLRNARHADDPRPLDEESNCPAARDYSRAYLHHLIKSGEALGAMLLSWNNVAYYQQLMQAMRDAIEAERFADASVEIGEGWARGDLPAL